MDQDPTTIRPTTAEETFADGTKNILRVAELRQLLAGLADDTIVVIDDEANGWWNHIAATIAPDPDDGHFTLTLVPGASLDTRDF